MITRRIHHLAQAIGNLVPSFVFRIKSVFVLWLPSERWVFSQTRSGLRWATHADENQIANLGRRAESIATRLDSGSRGVVKEINGKIIGCLWFDHGNPTYDGWLRIQLSEIDNWIFDVYVDPEHRGKEISKQMGDFARAEMAKHGIRRVAAITNTLNLPAYRSSTKVKYEDARVWYLRILGWTLVKFPCGWRFGWYVRKRPLLIPLGMITGSHSNEVGSAVESSSNDA